MRFLHTSDWHLGKTLRNQKRDGEHAAALVEVLDIAKHQQIDCLLVAGDIFDSVAPPPEAERIVFDFFRELVGARIPAVIIGGNHDHPRRLSAFSRILDLVSVHLRGEPVVAEEGGIIEVQSRNAGEIAVVAALPWVSERKVVDYQTLWGGERFDQYAEGVAAMMGHLGESFRPDTVNVLMSHILLDDSKVGGPDSGERQLHMGQAYVVRRQLLPSNAQYVALGHVHMPQEFPLANAYYCGSLLQVDFGEAGQQKRVNIVEVAPGRRATVTPVPLTSIRQLRNLGSAKAGLTLEEVKSQADSVGDAYLKVFLKADRPVPGLAQQVRDLLPNAVQIEIAHLRNEDDAIDIDIHRESPLEVFNAYYRSMHSTEPPQELMALFQQLYEEVALAAH